MRAARVTGDLIDSHPNDAGAAEAEGLFQSLLYAVSHDLRSPLLTMSLSADLLEGAIESADSSARVALQALRDGARDAERMLQGLTLLSRAYRRPVTPTRSPLRVVLAGHLVISDASDLDVQHVAVDALAVRDMLDAVAGDEALELSVRLSEGFARIEFDAPGVALDAASPLEFMAGALQYSAGSPVEGLAVGQILLQRQGGSVTCSGRRITIRLPLVRDAS